MRKNTKTNTKPAALPKEKAPAKPTAAPKVYNADRNDYQGELKTFARTGGKRKPRAGKLTVFLGILALLLMLGIAGMLLYWVKRFL